MRKKQHLVRAIASRLDLRDLKEVPNLSYNYVLSGFQGDNPIILKLGLDKAALKQEAFGLKCFYGYGAVHVLAEDHGMLLLERAVPGTSLKNYFLKYHSRASGNLLLDPRFHEDDNKSIEITCGVMKKLHQASIPNDHTANLGMRCNAFCAKKALQKKGRCTSSLNLPNPLLLTERKQQFLSAFFRQNPLHFSDKELSVNK